MLGLLVRWVLLAFSLIVVTFIVPGIYVSNFGVALVAGIMIGLVNTLIGPILKILTLPFSMMTFGLFVFVVNAFLFWLAALMVPGFEIHGFLAALIGSLLLSIINTVLDRSVGALIRI